MGSSYGPSRSQKEPKRTCEVLGGLWDLATPYNSSCNWGVTDIRPLRETIRLEAGL